ncbi:hypothetical protein [Clostridium minihomine]|uniref:hypothetical protein n=1 Tax=Clostridium minihomine TaxID=2045012 RepID=UPI000C75654A|nr:hypothetical protein [Clostridium minihomine]
MKRKHKIEYVHPRDSCIKKIFIGIAYLFFIVGMAWLVCLIVIDPNGINGLGISAIFFMVGFYQTFFPRQFWEHYQRRYTFRGEPKRYYACVSQKRENRDRLWGVAFMITFGLCFLYSLIKVIFFLLT